jgi:SAM-dependent methyltransferase
LQHYDDKTETQKQWNADPCGAVTGGELEPGTPAFYARVTHERYENYAPWMKATLRFERFAGQRVLEIGPGLGTDHAEMARAGARLVALDLTSRHLELTRKRFELEGLRAEAVRGDAERLPFPAGSFDAVYSFGVIHHTPDMPAAVEEIRRVLRPGGLALLGLYHRHSAFYWIHTMLLRGLVLGGLITKGHRRLLSEIEYRAPGSDAVPLVQVLSRADCRRLCVRFGSVELQTAHIELSHFLPLFRPGRLPRVRRLLERVAKRWGWYLIVSARK